MMRRRDAPASPRIISSQATRLPHGKGTTFVSQSLARPNVLRLKPYVPGKPIEETEREYGVRNIIKLASNENPLGPSRLAVAAMKETAEQVHLYPDAACFALTQSLAAHWDVAPETLILGNGSDEILHFAGLAFLQPGDDVLTGEPSFVRYESAAILNDANYIAVPLREYRFDLEAMAERLTDRTKMVFIANPNNPTGTIVTTPELERFLDRVPERAIVVLDEAYFEYAESREYPDGLKYVREGRNVLVLRTFSKIYGLAGLRVGYGIGRPDLVHCLHQVREPFNVSTLAQVAAQASLRDPEQVSRSQANNLAGREAFYTAFHKMGLRWAPTEANFVFLDLGRDCRPVYEALLRRGIIVRTGDIFGMPTHIRVTIGTPEENGRFLQELGAILAGTPAGTG
jgi:histidinol-phosphate aminotransferase